MKAFTKYLFLVSFLTIATVSYAQEQPEMDPHALAAKELTYLTTYLKLNDSQTFFVDSILVSNYAGMFNEFEDKRNSGMQNPNTYKYVSDKWLDKNIAALKLVLDEQQHIKYLKHVGKGKEYKKGKDGLYYKKEESGKKSPDKKK